MINDRHKLYNINNTVSNNDNNNDKTNDSFSHISHRTNSNNNNNKNPLSVSGCRDKVSVNSFRRYACQQCDKIFTDPSVLHQHSKSVHSTSRSHSCPECSKNFASSSGLKQHQHIHQSVKPFRCEVCLKAYTQFSNLCRHKRMHADCRQQIKCLDCGQAFSTLMSLNKHRRFCEGVMRRHGVNHASCFLPLSGLEGTRSIVTPGAASALAIHPSLGALESWCMHLYGCRPSAFPVCPPAGYMACLPPSSALFPSQSMLAAAAQSSPLLLGSYMGLLPLQEDERKEDSSLLLNSRSSSSSTEDKRRRSREQKPVKLDGLSSITSPSGYQSQMPETGRVEATNADAKWPLEGFSGNIKKEKEDDLEEEEQVEEREQEAPMEEQQDEEDRKNILSSLESTHQERGTSGSPLPRTPSPDETESVEDQQPLDLSTKSRTDVRAPLTEARTFSSRQDHPSSTSRPRSGTFEDSLRRPTGNDAKQMSSCKRDRRSLESSSFVPGTGFLSPVYHLRKDLIASYGGRDPSTVHPNGSYQLAAGPELDNISNIRGFVGKADAELQSTLLSPLVRLPDILSFKSSKPRYRYSCRYCGKVFPRSANLTRHLRTHTGEQPYRCKYCKRCFSISSNLQRHVRNIHNKEKPFRCPLCERCFGQQTNLDRHIKKHDADTVIDPCFSVADYLPLKHAGSRPSSQEVKGHGLRQDEPYFKEIQNYFANTSAASSAFFLGRVGGQTDDVTGSGKKEEEEEGEGEDREGDDPKIKTESSQGVDDTLQ